MKRTIQVLALALILGAPTAAFAQGGSNFPSLVGAWNGASEAVVIGSAQHHPTGTEAPTPRVSSANVTFTVTGQDGRRFWGTMETQHGTEDFVGILGSDDEIVAQMTEGSFRGRLTDENTIELAYTHGTEQSLVAAFNELKRSPN